jgi:hypothetical protein
VEKEGFDPLWEAVNLADRYDMAIMSTKGMSVTAARQLVDELSKQGVTILVLRDFDKAGFSIVGTLRGDTWRWQYETSPHVVDLGLRLVDVEELGLQSEPVEYDSNRDPRENLREHGATESECESLVQRGRPGRWYGERVEINAMTSDQLVEWLERKLNEIGVGRVIPDDDVLDKAYKRAWRLATIQQAIDKATAECDGADITLPTDLQETIRQRLDGSTRAWDDVVFEIAGREVNDSD